VASTIAVGSGNPAETASSSQRVNCFIGQASSISGVSVVSINDDLYMPPDYRNPGPRRLNEATA
jgi:hypothetical protein